MTRRHLVTRWARCHINVPDLERLVRRLLMTRREFFEITGVQYEN